MSDLPLHRTMQDDEIDRLKAQLKEYEAKGRVLMDMCRDLKARLLHKQAEAVESLIASHSIKSMSGDFIWTEAAEAEVQRLRQQADEAERAGGE